MGSWELGERRLGMKLLPRSENTNKPTFMTIDLDVPAAMDHDATLYVLTVTRFLFLFLSGISPSHNQRYKE